MSRSFKKTPIYKEGKSWKWEKTTMNRHNRTVARQAILDGKAPIPTDKKICSMDYDYCKHYIDKGSALEFPKLLRK